MTTIDTKKLKQMFIAGADLIDINYEYIDELNVFPVPDGDTGTNMKITIAGAVKTIIDLADDDLFLMCKTFARGLLMNARGNSGVILSQIIKGFVSVVKPSQKELSIAEIIEAFVKAKEVAYRSVATPVEGTILTVIRVVSEKLLEKSGTYVSVEQLFSDICLFAEDILAKTPDFLPELKNVGVVDSGGYGLCRLFEGMRNALDGKISEPLIKPQSKKQQKLVANFEDTNEGFGYCCEFIMQIKSKVSTNQDDKDDFDEQKFKNAMNKIGDSIVYVRDEDLVKVHIHSINPNKVLAIGSKYGEFNKIKIENMTLQFLQKNPGTTLEDVSKVYAKKTQLHDRVEIIATVPSLAMSNIYNNDLKILSTINCEESGNPSIQQFLDKIKESHAKNVIMVTDNSNIVLAATEAKSLISKKLYSVELIPCKDIASSYIVCLAYNPLNDFNTNVRNMNRAFKSVIVAKISKSIKIVKYEKVSVKKDDTIGIIGHDILFSSDDSFQTCQKTIDELFKRQKKAKSMLIITGKDAVLRITRDIEKYINETYNLKCETVIGDQPIYSYYFAIKR